jgi:hypothetical protein
MTGVVVVTLGDVDIVLDSVLSVFLEVLQRLRWVRYFASVCHSSRQLHVMGTAVNKSEATTVLMMRQ